MEKTEQSFEKIETWADYRLAVTAHTQLYQAAEEHEAFRPGSATPQEVLTAIIDGLRLKMAACRNAMHDWERQHPPLDPEREIDANFEASRDYLGKITVEIARNLHQSRERICEAFLAETGLLPSKVEQVVQVTPEGVHYFLRERKTLDTPELPAIVHD